MFEGGNLMKLGTKIQNQVNHWRLYAKVLPLGFLALLFLLHTIGWDSAIQKILVCGGTIMFASAVVWWYWVLQKVYVFAGTLSRTVESIDKIGNEIKGIKKEIKDELGNRKR